MDKTLLFWILAILGIIFLVWLRAWLHKNSSRHTRKIDVLKKIVEKHDRTNWSAVKSKAIKILGYEPSRTEMLKAGMVLPKNKKKTSQRQQSQADKATHRAGQKASNKKKTAPNIGAGMTEGRGPESSKPTDFGQKGGQQRKVAKKTDKDWYNNYRKKSAEEVTRRQGGSFW